jgi:WD40 repeat protein
VALHPNGKRVAAGSADGLIRLWDVPSGKHILTLLAFPSGETTTDWLAWTPEGYLADSPGVPPTAHWRMGGQDVEGAPVWKALNHPEMIAQALRGEKLTAPVFGK